MENKKGRKALKIILYTLAAVFVALLVIIPFLLESVQDVMEHKASILSGTVEKGDISLSVSGAGTLTDDDGFELTVPEGVDLMEYLVSDGDMVKKGDLIARTDRTSVMLTIDAVQETMDWLSEELSEAEKGKSTQTVCANNGGRLKAVYAQPGDNVQEVMLQHGCLAVMSIDGYMALGLKTDTLEAGDAVTVVLSDGTETEGKVEVVRNGLATVLISDQYGNIGESVEVLSSEGNSLGSAELYVHSEWRAVAYTGTVSSVRFTEGKTVRSGAVLFNLKDTLTTAAYDSLVSQRREYEDMMQRLFAMYTDGGLTAPCDGIVSGLDDSLLYGAEKTEEEQLPSDYSGYDFGDYSAYSFMFAGYDGSDDARIMLLAANNPKGDATDLAPDNAVVAMVTGLSPETHTMSVKQGCSYIVEDYLNPPAFATDESTMSKTSETYMMPLLVYVYDSAAGQWLAYTPQVGDVFLLVKGSGGYYDIKWMIYLAHNDYDPTQDPFNNNGGSGTGGFNIDPGLFGGFSFGGYTQEEEFEPYSTEESVAAEIIPPEKMTVTITVDELDILLLSTGMDAQVTIDALPGQSFPGTVTSIDRTASNSGGNTKFTAEITVDRNGYMLSGMNAGIMIVTSEHNDIPLIPVEALCEEGGKTVVYRGYDEDSECLTDPVEVKTGVSDGINVEILSGLSAGDSFSYSYLDTLDIYSMLSR